MPKKLEAYRNQLGLAMDFADVKFMQGLFQVDKTVILPLLKIRVARQRSLERTPLAATQAFKYYSERL